MVNIRLIQSMNSSGEGIARRLAAGKSEFRSAKADDETGARRMAAPD
jgi:hypothetical protein